MLIHLIFFFFCISITLKSRTPTVSAICHLGFYHTIRKDRVATVTLCRLIDLLMSFFKKPKTFYIDRYVLDLIFPFLLIFSNLVSSWLSAISDQRGTKLFFTWLQKSTARWGFNTEAQDMGLSIPACGLLAVGNSAAEHTLIFLQQSRKD